MGRDASCLMYDLCRKVDSFEDLEGLVIFIVNRSHIQLKRI